jgi:DNA-binding LacI/PurR family transcriptional regulator
MDAKRATLQDVAAAAGVSRSLAGFVLGDDHGKSIPEATRQRVRDAARSLGYAPHGIARALREGASRIVVLSIDPSLESNYSRTFARGLDDELAAHGHLLLIRQEHSGTGSQRLLLDAISPRAIVRLPGNYLVPGQELDDGGWDGGYAANVLVQLRYLADRGHAGVAVALPDGEPPLGPVRVRFAREAAGMLGLPEPGVLVIPQDKALAAGALRTFLSDHPAVTAVAAFDDDVALRVLAAMRSLGLAAPADLAVIGFDDAGYGALVAPALTSVHVDAEGHGRKAAREVLGLEAGHLARFTPGRVIVRESA